jgi:CheY-like chemotaxis protein
MNPEEQATIMVVDDDPGHRATLQTVIRSWGYALEVTDGHELVFEYEMVGCCPSFSARAFLPKDT